jgi:hypothetical protein
MLYQADDADRFVVEGYLEIDSIEKAGETADGTPFGQIRGIISSEHEDEDGEVVVQKGIDWSYFLDRGKLTYGHPARPDNVCGEPMKVEATTVEGVPATAMEGRVFLQDRLGKAVWDKAMMLQKSGAKTRLGLSIEGVALERDPAKPKRVLRSKVYTAAVDASPKNHVSLMDAIAASIGPALGEAGLGSFSEWAGAGFPEIRLVDLSKASAPASPVEPETYRQRLSKGVSDRELLAVRVSREIPEIPWSAALSLVEDLIAKHHQGGSR